MNKAFAEMPAPSRLARRKFEFRNAAKRLQTCDAHEVIISGPSETGKTIAALARLHKLMCRYPGAQAVIVRKTYQSTVGSVIQTFINKVLVPNGGVTPFGGERPAWFDYDNGSRVWVGGMDNPDKTLSTERDIVYVNQAEELNLSDWEYLTTRATGRAGNMPFGQVMGDCNPSYPTHWIRTRQSIELLESRHEDNPLLFDDAGAITEQGQRTLSVLDKLTGVRKERLRYGRWVQAEGAVYEFDRAVHLIDRFNVPGEWRRFLAVDFGFTNPFVCQWWAVDNDGRMYLYREIYMTQRTVSTHAQKINGFGAEHAICDHDAEDNATLRENGLDTERANKAISVGIQKVQDRLRVADDGKPRLFVMRDSLVELDDELYQSRKPVCTEQEFDVYMWPRGQDGKAVKEIPVDANNHGMDALRYAVMYVDGVQPTDTEATQKANPHTESRFNRNSLAGGRWRRNQR